MWYTDVMRFTGVSDQDLVTRLEGIVRDERRLVATMIAYLAEVEARRIHLQMGFSSMHDFCMRKLGFSEDQASRRIAAARDVRQYPQLLEAVADGRLHLSGIDRIRPHLTDDNVDEWISAAAGKSRREIEELIARRAPKPDVPDAVRLIPQQATLEGAPAPSPALGFETGTEEPPPRVTPIAEDRYAISFTASRAMLDKLEKVRGLTRHRNPKGELAIIFEAGLDLQLAKLEKQKKAKTTKPRRAKASSDPGYVSAETRREVHERDQDQCAYVSPDGARCPARELLELDHMHPRALGGTGDAANIRLLCRPHNLYVAEQTFGREHIEEKIAAARMHSARTEPSATRGSASVSKPRLETSVPTKSNAPDPRRRGSSPAPERGVDVTGAPFAGDTRSPRETAYAALTGLGFRAAETQRVLDALPAAAWSESLQSIVRAAIGRLT